MTRDYRGELAPLRARIAELQDERRRLRQAPPSFEEACDAIRRWVQQTARRWDHGVRRFVNHARHPRDLRYTLVSGSAYETEEQQREALLCALLPERVETLLIARLTDEYGQREGLTTKERDARLQAVETELRDLEVREEALIVEAEGAGIAIARRAEYESLDVLLGIEGAGDPPKGRRRRLGFGRAGGKPAAGAAKGAT